MTKNYLVGSLEDTNAVFAELGGDDEVLATIEDESTLFAKVADSANLLVAQLDEFETVFASLSVEI